MWFQFDRIEQIDREQFEALFIEVPEANATLYWVDEAGTPGLRPELQPPRTLTAAGDSILHLSDLHYGDLHAFSEGWGDGKSMVEVVSNRIEELEVSVGVVAVTGDLITSAKQDGYADAERELADLLERFQLEKSHIVIVPGNHDIDLDTAIDKGTRKYAHESNFRSFMKRFYGGDIEEIESLTRYETPGGWTLSFVGLNSVRLRDAETKDFGYVGHRSEPWLRRLVEINEGKTPADLVAEKKINFVMLHHHLLPATREAEPRTPVSVTVDAAKLIAECQRSAIHVALEGHQHYPFVASTARVDEDDDGNLCGCNAPLWVVGAGSCGAKRDVLPDQLRENSFGLYTPRETGLHVLIEQFNPSEPPKKFREMVLPLGIWAGAAAA